jgi:hypothetical protein
VSGVSFCPHILTRVDIRGVLHASCTGALAGVLCMQRHARQHERATERAVSLADERTNAVASEVTLSGSARVRRGAPNVCADREVRLRPSRLQKQTCGFSNICDSASVSLRVDWITEATPRVAS